MARPVGGRNLAADRYLPPSAPAMLAAQPVPIAVTQAQPEPCLAGQFILAADADGRLCLRAIHRPAQRPLCIDWGDADLRRRIAAGRGQPLARAAGFHRRRTLQVVDATAGLGRDGFVLAALGARVTMIERQPAIHALLADALARARGDSILTTAAERIRLLHADAATWLTAREATPDVVYLDPMYPEDGKSALPAKALQWLRELTAGDTDADDLLAAALAAAPRVAVKRPRHAPPLAGLTPQAQIRGTQLRFDIYLRPGGPCAA